jgi:hypothetical protein
MVASTRGPVKLWAAAVEAANSAPSRTLARAVPAIAGIRKVMGYSWTM